MWTLELGTSFSNIPDEKRLGGYGRIGSCFILMLKGHHVYAAFDVEGKWRLKG